MASNLFDQSHNLIILRTEVVWPFNAPEPWIVKVEFVGYTGENAFYEIKILHMTRQCEEEYGGLYRRPLTSINA